MSVTKHAHRIHDDFECVFAPANHQEKNNTTKKIKNPASSPASNIRERKYRDCHTKIHSIMNQEQFFE
jgi:hypothetical protein